MSLKVPKYLIFGLVFLFQLVNAALDYQLGATTRSVSLYSIPVLCVALFCSYLESLLFTVGTAILYVYIGFHGGKSFSPAEAIDLVFLFGIAILINRLISEHRSIRELAANDQLTGLLNHAHIVEEIEREIARAHRYGREMALLMIDIDHFKQYNDTYGHQQGDLVLRETAYVLRSKIRTTDVIGRYGGEEFALVLPETNLMQARIVGERLRSAVPEHTAKHNGVMETVHISVGIATCTPGIKKSDMLIAQADQALYQAKRQGRNQVALYTSGSSQETRARTTQPAEVTSGT